MSEKFTSQNSEKTPLDVEKIDTKEEARLVLMDLGKELLLCQGVLKEAREALAQAVEVEPSKWREEIEGLENTRIPKLQAEIEKVREKMESLPEE